jgi:thiol-disulfide isomerase/thioredoxin
MIQNKYSTIMKRKTIILLLLITISIQSIAQRKKAEFLDTLGNKADFLTFMSIYNTGKFRLSTDNSNKKVRYVKWERYNQAEIDSVLENTKTRILMPEKTGMAFNYSQFKDVNGNTFDSEYLKGKILVINFWFVGCGPCEIEMPELNKLVNQYKDNKEVVFISFSRSSESKTRQFLNRKKFNYPTVAMDEALRNEFKISAYPTNYVIDKNGTFYFASKGVGAGSVTLINKAIQEQLRQ